MLTIQSISSNISKSPTFKSIYDSKESYEKERQFFEDQRAELDEVINDNYIPESMKKPFKAARIVTNGVVDGLAVGWAAMAGANSCKKAAGSKVAKNIAKAAKPVKEGSVKLAKKLFTLIGEGFKLLKDSKFGKRTAELYNKFAVSKYGKPVVEVSKKVVNKVVELAKKVLKPIKEVTYDKASKVTAGTLGAGSGVAGAYATAREENPIKTEKYEDEE